jgi:hypothetical protein
MEANLVKHIDPRLNLTADKQFSTSQGASYISVSTYRPNGTIGSSVNFSCNPPNRNIVVSRKVIKKASFQVRITGTANATGPLLTEFKHGPAYLPISRITLNESMKIGNDTITGQNTDIVREALCRYDKDCYYTGAPSMNDTYQKFEDVVNTNRSALAPYGDTNGGQYGGMESRRAYYDYDNNANPNITNGNPVDVVLTFSVEEPLFLSPFVFGKNAENSEGIYGIESCQYTAQFGNLNKVWTGIDLPVDDLNVAVTITDFALKFKYLTPQINQPVPRNALYAYYEPQVRTAQRRVLNANTTDGEVQNINLQLSGIPRRIYMLARDTTTSGNVPLRYLSLVEGSLQVRINGQSSLQGQSNIQLYDMCRRNGLRLSYSQWSKYVGSVVCVDFGAGDIALHPEQAPAVNQKNEFEFQAQWKNNSDDNITYEFTVIVIYDGLFRMEDGNTSHNINPIDEKTLLGAPTDKTLHVDNEADDVYGGSLKAGLHHKMKGMTMAVPKAPSGGGLENRGGRMVSRASLRSRY